MLFFFGEFLWKFHLCMLFPTENSKSWHFNNQPPWQTDCALVYKEYKEHHLELHAENNQMKVLHSCNENLLCFFRALGFSFSVLVHGTSEGCFSENI